MDADSAICKGRLLRMGNDGRKLVQATVVGNAQVYGALRQDAHQGEAAPFGGAVHRGDIQLHGLPKLPGHIQHIHGRGFHRDFPWGFRQPPLGGHQIHQFHAHRIVVAQIHIVIRYNTGNIGMANAVNFSKGSEIPIGHLGAFQHDHVHIANHIMPLLQLCLIDAPNTQHQGADHENREKNSQHQIQVLPFVCPEPGGGHGRIVQFFHTHSSRMFSMMLFLTMARIRRRRIRRQMPQLSTARISMAARP